MQQQTQEKNPALAAILSFLINGLGQIYNGEVGKGLIIIGVQIINGLLMFILIGFITAPIVFIWSIYDAYTTAQRLNAKGHQDLLENTKQCPQCAERVNREARVCRFCSFQFAPVAALPQRQIEHSDFVPQEDIRNHQSQSNASTLATQNHPIGESSHESGNSQVGSQTPVDVSSRGNGEA